MLIPYLVKKDRSCLIWRAVPAKNNGFFEHETFSVQQKPVFFFFYMKLSFVQQKPGFFWHETFFCAAETWFFLA